MFVRWRNLQMNRSIMLSPDDVLPCPGMSGHVLACPGLSCPVLSCPGQSWPVLALQPQPQHFIDCYLFIIYLICWAWLPRDGQMMGEQGVSLCWGCSSSFLGLAFYLFIYYYCYVVCFFFEFILNNLIQHQFYGFAATPGGLSAGRGWSGPDLPTLSTSHTHAHTHTRQYK